MQKCGKILRGEKMLSPPWFLHCGGERPRRPRRSDASESEEVVHGEPMAEDKVTADVDTGSAIPCSRRAVYIHLALEMGRPREPALCQPYRRLFVPYIGQPARGRRVN